MAAEENVNVSSPETSMDQTEQTFLASFYDYGFPVVVFLGVLLILHVLVKVLLPYVFPMFLDRVSRKYNRAMGSFKHELLKDLETLREKPTDKEASVNGQTPPALTIMEIGVGTGTNFKYYPAGTAVIGIEPNKNFAGYLEKNVAEYLPGVRLQRTVVAYAEDLRGHVEDNSVDAVVSTLVLCSIKDVDGVMREVKRVLKPGGKFYFLEHVAADPETWTSTIQWLLRPLWKYIGDGCNLDSTPWVNVDRAGFSKVYYTKFLAHPKMPRVLRPHLMGCATK